LLKKCVSCHFSAAGFFLDSKLRKAANAQICSASKPLLLSFAWWHRCVAFFGGLPYLPDGSGEKICFGALTIVLSVAFVVRDVWCRKIWTKYRQAESFMSRFVRLINSNIPKSAFWPSFQQE
jgi:hypothetical protein